jgi:hypothetical protein
MELRLAGLIFSVLRRDLVNDVSSFTYAVMKAGACTLSEVCRIKSVQQTQIVEEGERQPRKRERG